MRILSCLVLAAVFSTAFALHAGETKLPAPKKTGGPGLFDAIDKRSSAAQSTFPKGKLGQEDLATILWAATGLNRDGRLWTVPMAMSKQPYCKVYYVDATGGYLYSWKTHSLTRVSDKDLRASIAMQNFAKEAPGMLIVAVSGEDLKQLNNNPFQDEFAVVLAGAMSQNIYLACEGLDVGARLVYSINRDDTEKQLGFGEGDKALYAILIGKK